MMLSFRKSTDDDIAIIRLILESQHLPTESVGKAITEFYLALEQNQIVGIAGFEYYGEDVLLRSVAVPSDFQNKGFGSRLVDWMIALAKQKQLKRIVLLTETAEKFFAKKGFVKVERSSITNVPLRRSSQFGSCCCSSAACMKLDL